MLKNPIKDHPGYFAGDDGEIYHEDKKLHRLTNSVSGKPMVKINTEVRHIHVLVWEAFNEPTRRIYYKDGNNKNIRLDNLQDHPILKTKECLFCKRIFKSKGPGNRFCDNYYCVSSRDKIRFNPHR